MVGGGKKISSVEAPDDLASCVEWLDDLDTTGGRGAQQAVAMDRGYDLIDMTDLICPQGVCAPVIGNVLVYRDRTHITVTYLNTMADELEQRLTAVLEQGG